MDVIGSFYDKDFVTVPKDEGPILQGEVLRKEIRRLEKRMKEAAANLEFEEASRYRDKIQELEVRTLA